MVNSKSFSNAFLAAIIISGLILASATRFGAVEVATGDSDIPKPSALEFTLKYVDRSYDVPPNFSYEIDPYTGEEVRTGSAGHHVENKTIEITIENQPFAPYTDANNHHISLYYNITYKGHYEETWHRYLDNFRKASDDAYTVLTLGLSGRPGTYDLPSLGEISEGSEIDFRVQVFIGYSTTVEDPIVPGFRPSYHEVYTGETSDWSNTQTITVGDEQTPNPSPVPDKLVNTIVVAVIIVVIGAGVGVLIYFIKRK